VTLNRDSYYSSRLSVGGVDQDQVQCDSSGSLD
jgi:hypothetical protein